MKIIRHAVVAAVTTATLFTTACSGGEDPAPAAGGNLVVEGAESVEDDAPASESDDGASESTDASESVGRGPGKEDSPSQAMSTLSSSDQVTAAEELAQLKIKPKGDMSGYKNKREELFGNWRSGDKATDVAMAGNGCDTRNDILARDLSNVKKDGDCTVTAGRLWDPYGTADNPYEHYINFERGPKSSAVQIDHLVALGNVWASGGDKLSEQDRLRVANDPINLIAVDGPENGRKQDKDASEWLPHNDRIHCVYAASQIRVKAKYNLTVTQAEHDKLAELITQCKV